MHLCLTSHEPWNSNYCTEKGQVLYKVVCPSKLRSQTAAIWRALPDLKPTDEGVLWAERHSFHSPTPEESTTQSHCSSHSTGVDNDFEIHEESRRKSFESHDHDFQWGTPPPTHEFLDKLSQESEKELKDNFVKLAEIDFHTISSTHIRYMGEEWKTNEFFRKEGWGWYGSNRIFTGSDGKEYRWKMGSSVSELFLHDTAHDTTKHDSKTHVPLLVARFHDPQVSMYQKRRPASLEIFPVGEHMVELILITFIYIEKMRTDRQNSAVRSTRIVTTPNGTKVGSPTAAAFALA